MNQHFFRIPWATSGDKATIPDTDGADPGVANYGAGWGVDYSKNKQTDPTARSVERGVMNRMLYDTSVAIAAWQTAMAPEFITTADNGGAAYAYGSGVVVKWRAVDSDPWALYISQEDNNTTSPGDVPAVTKWKAWAWKVASDAEMTAGTSDARVVTPLKLATWAATGGAPWVSEAELADPTDPAKGAALAGYSGTGGTVADALDAIQLADYAALRAYAGSKKDAYVTGLGIAGEFTRDDADTTSADNGGTVIVASNGKRWKRAFSGAISLGWFAVGNGTVDARAAILSVAKSNTKIEGVPGEVYRLTAPLVLTDLQNFTLDVRGADFRLDIAGTPAAGQAHILRFNSSTTFGQSKNICVTSSVLGGRLSFANAPTSRVDQNFPVTFDGVDGAYLSFVEIDKSWSAGVWVRRCNNVLIYKNYIHDTKADGCTAEGCGRNVAFVLNTAKNTADDGFAITWFTGNDPTYVGETDGVKRTKHVIIEGNQTYDSGKRGIFLGGAQGGAIAKNRIERSNAVGILLARDTVNPSSVFYNVNGVNNSNDNLDIFGNTLIDCSVGSNSPNNEVGGMWVTEYNTRIKVFDNYVKGANNISFYAGGNAEFVNNTSENPVLTATGSVTLANMTYKGAHFATADFSATNTCFGKIEDNTCIGGPFRLATINVGYNSRSWSVRRNRSFDVGSLSGVSDGITMVSLIRVVNIANAAVSDNEVSETRTGNTTNYIVSVKDNGGNYVTNNRGISVASGLGTELFVDNATADVGSAVATFATYAALRAYTGNKPSAYVTGYLAGAAPSGIAGEFTRDDADTTSTDNGGTIIVASNGKRWKRIAATPIDPQWFGAKDDYTGRVSASGTGTDSRAAIQAALNFAKDTVGTDYYAYLTRRPKVVKMRGHYLLSAPATLTNAPCESLYIPDGVVLDLSDASLYFDYPDSFTYGWCGIRVGQYGGLKYGGVICPSRRNSAPAGERVFDAVRFVFNDLASTLEATNQGEITGWSAGAGVHLIGAWITYLSGAGRISSGSRGIVASNYGTAWQGIYTLPTGSPGYPRRVNTDVMMDRFTIVNMSDGGIDGVCAGNTGNVYAKDFSDSGLTIAGDALVLENIGYYALNFGNVFNCAFNHLSIEECGNGDGVISLNTVRNFSVRNFRFNLAGRSVPGPSGNVTPFPSTIFKNNNAQCFSIDQAYVHNTYNAALTFADAAAAISFSVGNVFADSNVPPSGPMFKGGKGSISESATWNLGHHVFGDTHVWQDANGNFRKKNGAPTSDTDGDCLVAPQPTVTIFPFMGAIANTNWTSISIDAGAVNNAVSQSSGAQNDSIEWDVALAAGTYTISVMHVTSSNRGIYTVSLGGTSIGTIDGYAASAARNQIGQVAGVVVATGGVKRLKLQMATKNASSSQYYGSLQMVVITKTA